MSQRIGIWAGSSPTKRPLFERGLKKLKANQIDCIVPASTKRYHYRGESLKRPFLAGPDKLKVEALKSLLEDPSLREIFCVRGGYGTIRLLPHFDKCDIKVAGKKRLWGFSDLTVIQHYLFFKYDLAWVHSPMITSPSFLKPKGIEKKDWPAPLGVTSKTRHTLHIDHAIESNSIQAVMIGGNLASLMSMMGTRWEPKPTSEYILFIEDLAEEPRKLDRLLNQLSGTYFFKNCLAVVCGHFTDCPDARALIKMWAKESNVPLFWGLKVGHEVPNIPLPMGQSVTISIKSKSSALLEVPSIRLE
jgi:muramoyltetrapeptide carboxypeptidase